MKLFYFPLRRETFFRSAPLRSGDAPVSLRFGRKNALISSAQPGVHREPFRRWYTSLGALTLGFWVRAQIMKSDNSRKIYPKFYEILQKSAPKLFFCQQWSDFHNGQVTLHTLLSKIARYLMLKGSRKFDPLKPVFQTIHKGYPVIENQVLMRFGRAKI